MDSPGIDLEEGATLIEELSDWPALDDIFYDDATKFEGGQGEQIDIDTVIAATSPFGLDFKASAVRPSPFPSEASLAKGAHHRQDLGKHEVAPGQKEGTVDATHKKRRASRIRSREMSCRVCYLEKASCDRNFPCGRCFRYNKPCRPAMVTQASRRPVRGTSSSSLLFQSSPYLDLVIERSDLPAMVPLYLQAFQELFQEGVLSRKRAIGLLKSWVDLGVMMDGDCDPTFGAFAEVKAAFQIHDLELEDPECLAYEPPLHAEKGRLWAARADRVLGEGAKHLEENLVCRQANNSSRAVYMARMDCKDQWVISNKAHNTYFRSPAEFLQDMWKRRCLLAFLFAAGVAPEDRLAYFKLLHFVTLSTSLTKRTGFLKIFDRQGRMTLYLLDHQVIKMGPNEYAALCVTEPAPPSRHVTTRPDVTRLRSTHYPSNNSSASILRVVSGGMRRRQACDVSKPWSRAGDIRWPDDTTGREANMREEKALNVLRVSEEPPASPTSTFSTMPRADPEMLVPSIASIPVPSPDLVMGEFVPKSTEKDQSISIFGPPLLSRARPPLRPPC
ncbi:hypothetical protein NSK_005649 [Nannochloropsis salina CCMP1776]|uniref:Zn(2)-C6 fungal-type domain-containing protein n=1 Tax=Nannochloropsis salina CCMP1776 TaxID=1027361 RepID=A0A4D9CWU9_9STRA|nr:hypothetical protein NSK_005649 [Nannochloropsis salina CCMP1776]|eukprot:TFJ83024.1 hypothetical protein NSK_005649 [Nannochloropsis salina CCMP1776]